MKAMKKLFVIAMTCLLAMPAGLFAQEEEKDMRPVRDPFMGTLLGDQQTIISPRDKGLELMIHHRFGTMQNGLKDLYGIYAPSNIRLGLSFGVTEKLMVGIGTEKNGKYQEFEAKYNILKQTRGGTIPVGLSYYVNMAIDSRNAEAFGENYAFTNRFTYFHQLIIARKFGDRLSVQLNPSYAHFNAVDSLYHNDYWGIGAGAKFRAFGDFSIIANYEQGFSIKATRYFQEAPKPNLLLGFEVATPTHCFQLFAANYNKITPQANLAFNQNNFLKGEILVGMNVQVRF